MSSLPNTELPVLDSDDLSWTAAESSTADFGDARLDKRMAKLLERLASRPTVSIPAACQGWDETQAAYRFLSNAAVTPDAILAPHRDATLKRIAQEPVVLLIQDTTELDYSAKKDLIEGLGPLNDERRVGLFAHPSLAVTPAGLCLGLIHNSFWTRDDLDQGALRKQKAIEDKESIYWLEGYRQACAVARVAPQTTVVSISDRDGDIFECFAEALPDASGRKAEWLIRAKHNRSVQVAGETGRLWDQVGAAPVLGEVTVEVPRSPKRAARQAKLRLQALTIQPRRPYRPGGRLPEVTFQAVLAREIDPPPGEEAIEWLLLTSLAASTFAEACRVLEYYVLRWTIEVFFRVLKTGCKVETRQLQTLKRLEACLALYLIVAWRVLYVTWMGRTYPNLTCDVIFTEAEWKAVWRIVKKAPLPEGPPTLGEFIRLVASLGGHLGRKGDGDPGTQTVWIGLQRMHDFAQAWLTFGPDRSG